MPTWTYFAMGAFALWLGLRGANKDTAAKVPTPQEPKPEPPKKTYPLQPDPVPEPKSDMQVFLDKNGIKHFADWEVLQKGASNAKLGLNTDPPKAIWGNVVAPLKVLDEIRTYFDRPVHILSAYRSAAYNKAIGGASKSKHMEFRAFDFRVEGVSVKRVVAYLQKRQGEGSFIGGVGTYTRSGFIHIDTRGSNARWGS